MKSTFQFYPEDELLIIKYVGVFDLKEYQNHIQKVFESPNKIKIARILIDLRELKIDQKKTIFNQIFKSRQEIQKANFKMAYLAIDPGVIANLHLYIEKINNANYQYFSTLASSITHLGSNKTIEEFNKAVESL